MKTLEERLDQAEAMIQTTSFRENKGLGNEVGYYILIIRLNRSYILEIGLSM